MSAPERSGGPDGIALFLDFDGTLVEIAATPELVRVDPALPSLLTALRTRTGGALAIVTGRPIADIDAFLPELGLDVCGLHGLDRRVGGTLSRPPLPDLTPAVEALRAELASRPGVLVESKGVGVAVHWRLAPEAEAEASAALARLAERLGPDYRIQDGKAVRELVPAAAGKGWAVKALMSSPPYAGRQPVVIGDDRTDEHAFEAADELGGTAVKIGPGETRARRRVASPRELRGLLTAWLEGGPGPDRWDAA